MRFVYCIWCALSLTCCSTECFRVLQSTGYRPQRGYFKIVGSLYFVFLAVLQILCWVEELLLGKKYILCAALSLSAVILLCIRHKTPLKFTKRIWRMLIVQFVLLDFACFWLLHLWVILLPTVTLVSWLVCLPVDLLINKRYLCRASRKLKRSSITVIAITGSYGKTSTKDMLSALLQDSLSPAGSCNTPLGIAKFINSSELSAARYLILEFGARKRHDIEALCRLYPPQFGIVTGVCEQHLSTFKSYENVLQTKCELVQNIPCDGFCLLGDDSVAHFVGVGQCQKIRNKSVRIKNLFVSPQGLSFVVSKGRQNAQVSLPQITPFSADTFALCATMCLKLGQSFENTIANTVKVKQTSHRMEISHNGKFYIIDDSYNANLKGVESCCSTLEKFCGTKVVISQGIVEGGNSRRQFNRQCGLLLGMACDVLIVVGKNAKLLADGARDTHCKILFAKSVSKAVMMAQQYLARDSFLLFQNDLPDVVGL